MTGCHETQMLLFELCRRVMFGAGDRRDRTKAAISDEEVSGANKSIPGGNDQEKIIGRNP